MMNDYRKAYRTVTCRWLTVLIVHLLTPSIYGDDSPSREMTRPICIHPDNSKYFLFRDRAMVLISATEHYGSIINRPFNWEKYLRDAADKRQTLTRTFLLFRELQTPRNPSSPCKPESPDYIAPWPRTGPGLALDGEPRYDLDHWNPEYFERLHKFLSLAADLGIVVELTLFSNSYIEKVWSLNPLRSENNVQNIGKVPYSQYTSLHNGDLLRRQLAYVTKVIQETCIYDNVYYEICNEPGDGTEYHVTTADVDAWQARIASAVRDELEKRNRPHLVFGSQACSYKPTFRQELDGSFSGTTFDVVNVHPLPNTVVADQPYMLGDFMSKQLVLKDYSRFCGATRQFSKPCVLDEDNTASLYRDDDGWTIHRKRAWTAIFNQCHYDFIDFTITVGNEAGTRESTRKLRTWMKHLSAFIHDFDFVHATPMQEWLRQCPEHLVATVLACPSKDYIAYLADSREITDTSAGNIISGDISFDLPAGKYRASLFSPTRGEYSPAIYVQGGEKAIVLSLPPFTHDVVVHVTRQD